MDEYESWFWELLYVKVLYSMQNKFKFPINNEEY